MSLSKQALIGMNAFGPTIGLFDYLESYMIFTALRLKYPFISSVVTIPEPGLVNLNIM